MIKNRYQYPLQAVWTRALAKINYTVGNKKVIKKQLCKDICTSNTKNNLTKVYKNDNN